MSISNILKIGAGVLTLGGVVYFAYKQFSKSNEASEKVDAVAEIVKLTTAIYDAAEEKNYSLSKEDITDLNGISALTTKDDIVSLTSGVNILTTKLDRITGMNAEQRESERKRVGNLVVTKISELQTYAGEKKISLSADWFSSIDKAIKAVNTDASTKELMEHLDVVTKIMHLLSDIDRVAGEK